MKVRAATLGWTAVRVVFGLSLSLGHGLPKLMRGVGRFAESVASLGFPFPVFFAWCATLTELVGGLLVAVGLFTRPAAALGAFTMMVAIYRHRLGPFGKMELPLLYLVVLLAVVLAGGGPYSLDARVRGRG